MIEIFAAKRMRGRSLQYMWNCKDSDFSNSGASFSFASVYVQLYARCEIRSEIRLSVAKSKALIEIFPEFGSVYREGMVSKDKVMKWVREFKERSVDVYD